MKLIVGLGNPGNEYINSRHNIGFMCVDNYVNNFKESRKFNGFIAEVINNDEKILFLKPNTYMNNSGLSVMQVVKFYNIPINNILIIHDDLDLGLGVIKLKVNSSSGGHNGIKSIISSLGTNSFARLKIGVSNNKNISTKDYVLGKFNKDEMLVLTPIISKSKEIIDCFINDGIDRAMNIYNTK